MGVGQKWIRPEHEEICVLIEKDKWEIMKEEAEIASKVPRVTDRGRWKNKSEGMVPKSNRRFILSTMKMHSDYEYSLFFSILSIDPAIFSNI